MIVSFEGGETRMKLMVVDIHLMSIVECEYFEGCRPVLSQVLVRRALTAAGSELLQVRTLSSSFSTY